MFDTTQNIHFHQEKYIPTDIFIHFGTPYWKSGIQPSTIFKTSQ